MKITVVQDPLSATPEDSPRSHVEVAGLIAAELKSQGHDTYIQTVNAELTADLEDAYNRGMTTIAYSHIPIETLMGGKIVGVPPDRDKVPGPDADRFAELLTRYGCKHIFIGHMHYNEVKKFGDLTEILTRAAGIAGGSPYRWGYRLVSVKDGKITDFDKLHLIGFEDLE